MPHPILQMCEITDDLLASPKFRTWIFIPIFYSKWDSETVMLCYLQQDDPRRASRLYVGHPDRVPLGEGGGGKQSAGGKREKSPPPMKRLR